MRAKIRLSVMLAVGALALTAGSAVAANPPSDGSTDDGLSASIEGSPIFLSAVAALPCHDFEYPIIRCFRSLERLMAAVGAYYAVDDAAAAATAADGFVGSMETPLVSVVTPYIPGVERVLWLR